MRKLLQGIEQEERSFEKIIKVCRAARSISVALSVGKTESKSEANRSKSTGGRGVGCVTAWVAGVVCMLIST
jgi:hypothetical protein